MEAVNSKTLMNRTWLVAKPRRIPVPCPHILADHPTVHFSRMVGAVRINPMDNPAVNAIVQRREKA